MCVVSMVVDHYRDEWGRRLPETTAPGVHPGGIGPAWYPITQPQISPSEVDEFRRLLERAKEYDRKNNEPDCEMAEKIAALKTIAKAMGVELNL